MPAREVSAEKDNSGEESSGEQLEVAVVGGGQAPGDGLLPTRAGAAVRHLRAGRFNAPPGASAGTR